jgi:hypothetical protein
VRIMLELAGLTSPCLRPYRAQGHALWMGNLTSAQGRSLGAKCVGKRRAAFWRLSRYPNLVRARAARRRYALERKALTAEEESRRQAEKRRNDRHQPRSLTAEMIADATIVLRSAKSSVL